MVYCCFLIKTDRLSVLIDAENENKLFAELFGEKEPVTIYEDGKPVIECTIFREFLEDLIASNMGYVELTPDAATAENGEAVNVFHFDEEAVAKTQFVMRPRNPNRQAVSNPSGSKYALDKTQFVSRPRDS